MVQQHGDHHEIPKEHKVVKAGAWLPADSRIHQAWLGQHIEDAKNQKKELAPSLQEFKDFIESDARIYMYFNAMSVVQNV